PACGSGDPESGGTRRSSGYERPADARGGVALHRFSDSRMARNESDGQRDLVDGIRDRGCAAQKTLEAPGRESHAPALLFALVSPFTDLAAGGGSGSTRWIWRFAFPRARSRFAAGSRGRMSPGFAFFQCFGTLAGLACQND